MNESDIHLSSKLIAIVGNDSLFLQPQLQARENQKRKRLMMVIYKGVCAWEQGQLYTLVLSSSSNPQLNEPHQRPLSHSHRCLYIPGKYWFDKPAGSTRMCVLQRLFSRGGNGNGFKVLYRSLCLEIS